MVYIRSIDSEYATSMGVNLLSQSSDRLSVKDAKTLKDLNSIAITLRPVSSKAIEELLWLIPTTKSNYI